MKKEKIFILILVIVLMFGGAYKLYDELTREHTSDIVSGEFERFLAEDIVVYDKEENAVSLSDYTGKPIVMNFWASWCTPCQIEMPEFQKMYEKYGEEVKFLMINMTASGGETVGRAQAFIENGGYTFPILFDSEHEAAGTYDASAMPTTFFIDKEGYVVYQYVGAMNVEKLKEGIERILGE